MPGGGDSLASLALSAAATHVDQLFVTAANDIADVAVGDDGSSDESVARVVLLIRALSALDHEGAAPHAVRICGLFRSLYNIVRRGV